MKVKHFRWRGKEVKTMGDTLVALQTCRTPQELWRFRDVYKKACPGLTVDDNLLFGISYSSMNHIVQKQWLQDIINSEKGKTK